MNNIKKSIIPGLLLFGILIGGALIMSAFTEPTAGPGSTTSYVPINLGPATQIRTGQLGIGDGTNSANSTYTGLNSYYLTTVMAPETLTVRQNASLVGNIRIIEGNMIVGGALRVPEIEVCFNGNYGLGSCGSGNYIRYDEDPYFNGSNIQNSNGSTYSAKIQIGGTTNLGRGVCTQVTNSACPTGSILSKFDSTTGISSCRKINPDNSPTSLTSC